MSNSSISVTVNSTFNIISFFIDVIAVLICIIYLCAISYHLIEMKCKRRQIAVDVPLILSINIICSIFIKSILQIIHVTIPTLMKDFQIITEFKETSLLRIRAYILWSMVGVLYWSYVLLAFFSFIRVIYPTKLWLHRPSLHFYILISGQFICIYISLSPLFFIFDSLHQIPGEAYCSILGIPIYPMLYTSFIIFFIPVNAICIFYVCIARKMRRSLGLRQELHRRDFIVIRRMLINMIILSIVGLPAIFLYIIDLIQNHSGSISYRTQWLSSSTGSCLFSLILPLVTTRLRDIFKRNRLVPANNQNVV